MPDRVGGLVAGAHAGQCASRYSRGRLTKDDHVIFKISSSYTSRLLAVRRARGAGSRATPSLSVSATSRAFSQRLKSLGLIRS
jgi:hypothetical protein